MGKALLWYDGGQKPVCDKVRDAAHRYMAKFGALPNTCHVHPGAMEDGASVTVELLAGPHTIHLVPDPYTRPDNFLIGRREERCVQ